MVTLPVLLSICPAFSARAAGDYRRDVTFLVVADPQIYEGLDKKLQTLDDLVNGINGISAANRLAEPLGVVVVGDLTQDKSNYWDFKEFNHFTSAFEHDGLLPWPVKVKYPVYVGLGNHDLPASPDPYWEMLYKTGRKRAWEYIEKRHRGDSAPVPVSSFDDGSKAYSWDWGIFHCVQLHRYGGDQGGVMVGTNWVDWDWPSSLPWLETDLEKAARKYAEVRRPVLVFQHLPLDVEDWLGFTTERRTDLINTLSPYNVVGFFAGHQHPAATRLVSWEFSASDLVELPTLAEKLLQRRRAVDRWLFAELSHTKTNMLETCRPGKTPTDEERDGLVTNLVPDLNQVLSGPLIYDSARFEGIALSPETSTLLSQGLAAVALKHLNRRLLEDAYPLMLARKPNLPGVPLVTACYPRRGFGGTKTHADKYYYDPRFTVARCTDERLIVQYTADGQSLLDVAVTNHTIYSPAPPVLREFCASSNWTAAMARHLADVNGDGRDDVIGFKDDGCYVAFARETEDEGEPFEPPRLVLRQFDGQWLDPECPVLLGDVDANGRTDIVGFGYASVVVALAKGAGDFSKDQPFRDPVAKVPAFRFYTYGAGWRAGVHLRTLADVDGDGRDDIVGIGASGDNSGLRVAFAKVNPGADFPFSDPVSWAHYRNWNQAEYPVVLANVDGKLGKDIVGFGYDGAEVCLSTGKRDANAVTWTAPIRMYAFKDGWRVGSHPRVLADVNGDKCADIVGFGDGGVAVALATGNRNAPFEDRGLVLGTFGYDAGGWRVGEHLRLVTDINGDGRADLVGFAGAGVVVATAKRAGAPASDPVFDTPVQIINAYGSLSQGWQVGKHPRALADVNKDGVKEIVGFGDFGVLVTRLEECGNDTDGDGIPDGWEIRYGMKPAVSGDQQGDLDHDGLSALREYQEGTNPLKSDTDDDGLPDRWEVDMGLDADRSNPYGDPDRDGLTNTEEYLQGTHPQQADTDGDGVPDGWEVAHQLDPKLDDGGGDADGDSVTNASEYECGTDPRDAGSVLKFDSVARASDGKGLLLSWRSVDGKRYTIYYTDAPHSLAWTTLCRRVTATGSLTSVTDTSPPRHGCRFYQLQLDP